ncbi:hypothetical protein, partial [Chloroflexus sp.]|uniref:hypothetical protein n=1 Tax=Chloroflexus sp. TaxID=1904827 RepID=UPI00404B3DAC
LAVAEEQFDDCQEFGHRHCSFRKPTMGIPYCIVDERYCEELKRSFIAPLCDPFGTIPGDNI